MRVSFSVIRVVLIVTVGFFCTNRCKAQFAISGKVVGEKNEPIVNANVLLLQSKDSALVKGVIASHSGDYLFEKIPGGVYIINCTYSGFEPIYTKSFELTGSSHQFSMETLKLLQKQVKLSEVTVVAKKPLFEQKIDRMVINVANSVTAAGNTALEVLERSPGIIVDHQNNLLSMNGKDGVVIMINGKISHMPVSSIVQMLSGMNASNIEKIELISTPPANFDAAGNAGYINIVLKENNNVGTNGSYAATIGIAKYPLYNGSINFNHRKGKVNVFGDVSFSRVKNPLVGYFDGKVNNNGILRETVTSGNRIDTTVNLNGRFGIDYQAGQRTILGMLLTGDQNNFSQSESKNNSLFKNSNLDTLTKFKDKEQNDWKDYNININAQHNFSENKQLTINLDYIHYHNDQPVNYFASNYDGAGNFIDDESTRSGKVTLFTFWVGALDYTTSLSSKIKLQSGIKETIGGFNNDISYDHYIQDAWVKDPAYSANYKLNENYSAGYISFDINLDKKTDAKLGARYEYTNTNLGTLLTKNIVDRHYSNLFPTAFLTHTINENNKINLSYSMRIDRPAFTDLAPFTYFLDANTLITGNPALQASITNTINANYIFKDYLLTLSYSKEDKAIAGFQPEPDSVTGKTVFSPQNLINKKVVSAILSIPVIVNNWWDMQYNFSGLWQQSNLFYQEQRLRLSQLSYTFNATGRFKLPKQFSIELSGFYQSPSIDGILIRKASGSLDVGIRKKLKENIGNLIFSANNILNTLSYNGHVDLPAQNLVQNFSIVFSRPSFKITYTHNFGKQKLKENRDRSTGAEDEMNRVHN